MIVRISPATSDLLGAAAEFFTGAAADPAGFVQSPGTIALVAVRGLKDQAIEGWCWGYALPRPDGTRMLYLHHLEVTEPARRRGIGRRLVQVFAEAEPDATKLFLITGAANEPARRLYESLGGAPAAQGATENYWFALPLR